MLCCHSLTNLIDNAGQRGLAVLVCITDQGLRFALQMRAVTADDENNMKNFPSPSFSLPEHITLSESLRIRHCPSCGQLLDALAASNPELFSKLAYEHRPYQNDWGV
jgi:hypothetical protein